MTKTLKTTTAAFDACRDLNLTGLAPELETIVAHAIKQRLTYPAFLTHALN